MSIALKSINIKNLLSFGPDGIGPEGKGLPLESLNIIIGPNGSGKSNLLEAIGLLQAAPRDLPAPLRVGGGIREWLWMSRENEPAPVATIEAIVHYPNGRGHSNEWLRYNLSLTEEEQRTIIVDERLETKDDALRLGKPFFYFGYENGVPMLAVKEHSNDRRNLRRQALNRQQKNGSNGQEHSEGAANAQQPPLQELEQLNPRQSVLQQRKDPELYPELTFVGQQFDAFRLYNQWVFNRNSASRQPQPPDDPNDILEEDARNLGLVLNNLKFSRVRGELLKYLKEFYSGAEDVDVRVRGGSVQTSLLENGFRPTPATRLSDGTLRWLALMALLLDPYLPPLICIDEPELGLHPDIIPTLAELLREAAERSQLIITSHSADLVNEFTNTPEVVVICEKEEWATRMQRLEVTEELSEWLDKYRLGVFWQLGNIGGTRF